MTSSPILRLGFPLKEDDISEADASHELSFEVFSGSAIITPCSLTTGEYFNLTVELCLSRNYLEASIPLSSKRIKTEKERQVPMNTNNTLARIGVGVALIGLLIVIASPATFPSNPINTLYVFVCGGMLFAIGIGIMISAYPKTDKDLSKTKATTKKYTFPLILIGLGILLEIANIFLFENKQVMFLSSGLLAGCGIGVAMLFKWLKS